MARVPNCSPLTDAQKREACGILSIGCDRETVAKYLGCSPLDVRQAMIQDRRFAEDVRRAEAAIELSHMRNIQNAARDDKNWRVSVWWLERRAPERYGRREAGVVTTRQLQSIVSWLVDTVIEEVHDTADRDRLISRLQSVTSSLQQMLRGEDPQESEHTFTEQPSPHAELDEDLGCSSSMDARVTDDENEP